MSAVRASGGPIGDDWPVLPVVRRACPIPSSAAPRRTALAWSAATVITVAAAPAYAASIDTTCTASGCKEPGKRRRKTYRLTIACALPVRRVWIDDCPASLEGGLWTLRDHPDSSSPLPVVIETAAGRQVLRAHFKPCKEN